jgi:uncharacterized RDD family membrane protein YckC
MGEPLAPAKPVLPPPVAVVRTPPKAPPVVAVPPPPANPKPQPKPEPAVAFAPAPLPEPPVHTNGAVITPRPSFANTEGPGKVDLFDDDRPVTLSRFERPPTPAPQLPVPPGLGPSVFRGRRLAARLITLTGAVLAVAAGILLVGFAPQSLKRDKLLSTVFLFVPLGLYLLYNLVLLATQGQDFGKRMLKLKVVGDDGTPAGFGRAFLKRELVVVLLLAGLLPLGWKVYKHQQEKTLATSWQRQGPMFLMPEAMPAAAALLFSVLNAALILGKDGKCVHDKLAKTAVVRA